MAANLMGWSCRSTWRQCRSTKICTGVMMPPSTNGIEAEPVVAISRPFSILTAYTDVMPKLGDDVGRQDHVGSLVARRRG